MYTPGPATAAATACRMVHSGLDARVMSARCTDMLQLVYCRVCDPEVMGEGGGVQTVFCYC